MPPHGRNASRRLPCSALATLGSLTSREVEFHLPFFARFQGLVSAVALSERRGDLHAEGGQVGGEASYPGDKIAMFWDHLLGRSHPCAQDPILTGKHHRATTAWRAAERLPIACNDMVSQMSDQRSFYGFARSWPR